MTWRERLEVQCDFMVRNGRAVTLLITFLEGRDPSLMQISGFAKAVETTYNFLEGALRLFADAQGVQFSGASSHKDLLDWALNAKVQGEPLLPEGAEYDSWRMFRHKMKYQSLDLIVWGMIRDFVPKLEETANSLSSHFLSLASRLDKDTQDSECIIEETEE